MRYLYFDPKRIVSATAAERWPSDARHGAVVSLLQSCSKEQEISQLHAHMIRTRIIDDTFCASRIVACLASPSLPPACVAYARRVLDQIPHPNLFMWNSVIRGYTHHRAPRDALSVYRLMRSRGFTPDSRTCSALTRACAQLRCRRAGEAVHGLVVKGGFESDMYVTCGLVNAYASFGEVDVARELFDEMPHRDVVSWTSMLSGYAQMNRVDEAFLLFNDMKGSCVEPNKVTLATLLSACGRTGALDSGSWLHSQIREQGMEDETDVANSLIGMYAQCGSTTSATEIFNNMPRRNSGTWNALIGGFVQKGLYKEALTMFHKMSCSEANPDELTLMHALAACANLRDLQQGGLVHTYIEDRKISCDAFLSNALINMYAKCGDLAKAELVFNAMPEKDVFSWTTMISACVQLDRCKEALDLFERMQLANVDANEITLASILSACSRIGSLDHGRRVHYYMEDKKVKRDVSLANALMDMYAKCGCVETASEIFHGMLEKDTNSWNVMIGGLAVHGLGREALALFDQMLKIGDAKPDSITLLVVLCACAHAGLVNEGYVCFNSMYNSYGIIPRLEHYGCMIDLLSRANLLDEANDLVERMPMEPNILILGSLLAACKVHGKMEIAENIVKRIMKLKPDEGTHILISNVYAEAQRWDDVRQVRALIENKQIEKSPGYSSIEINGVTHEFFVSDKLACESDLIHMVLDVVALHSKHVTFQC